MNGWHCFPSWPPTPVFLPRECHGERNLTGYSPWGHKRVRFDLPTEHVRACTHTHTHTHSHKHTVIPISNTDSGPSLGTVKSQKGATY